jgi:hypothetical protein
MTYRSRTMTIRNNQPPVRRGMNLQHNETVVRR